MVWVTNSETLLATPEGVLRRGGRFLVWEFDSPHRVLSTCSRNGGQREDLRYLINHQSCEGTGHTDRHDLITRLGQVGYHSLVCSELQLDPSKVALMGTAANMNYVAISPQDDLQLRVVAVVTAGVQGNAVCAGDPVNWREKDGAWEKVNVFQGTINTILLINHPLTPGALARAAVTMTEAKSSALHRLAIGSLYSPDEATGTGTDQYCLAAPLSGRPQLSSASPHTKLGELIGLAALSATLEALRWQNGLEASYTRSIFHALARYGLTEKRFWETISSHLPEKTLELLRRNSNAVFYEPLVAAAAYSFAAVLDRVRYGSFPAGTISECLRQSAALLAANLAAQPHRFNEFKDSLNNVNTDDPALLLISAIAAGWSAKWS
jgi:adenosylcobinamide amidohydrolase